MRSFRDRNPYAVGLISIAVIGVIVGLAFAAGLFHLLEKAQTQRGEFTDAAGVRSGDDVKVAGVKVGRVTGVKADRTNGLVIISWKLNNGTDVNAKYLRVDVALETLLGSKFLRLLPTDDRECKPSDPDAPVVPVNCTTTPVDVFDLTRNATHQIEATHTKALNDLIEQLSIVTAGKKGAVKDLVVGIDKVSRALNERDTQLRSLLTQADDLSALLAKKDKTLVELIDASDKILDLISSRRDQLARALGEGSNAVDGLSRLLIEHKTDLDRILTNLHPTLDVVRKNQTSVDTALAYLGPGFYQQTAAGTHGPFLDVYIRSLGPDVSLIVQSALEQLVGP
jgi:phospholipid/cholesterol/gamma-HCH transport system substrate-binding protein